MELLNVESAKSNKNHGWRGLQRNKPVYTPLSLRDWVRASPRHPKKFWLGDCQAKRSKSPKSFNRNRSEIGKKKRNWMICIEYGIFNSAHGVSLIVLMSYEHYWVRMNHFWFNMYHAKMTQLESCLSTIRLTPWALYDRRREEDSNAGTAAFTSKSIT